MPICHLVFMTKEYLHVSRIRICQVLFEHLSVFCTMIFVCHWESIYFFKFRKWDGSTKCKVTFLPVPTVLIQS